MDTNHGPPVIVELVAARSTPQPPSFAGLVDPHVTLPRQVTRHRQPRCVVPRKKQRGCRCGLRTCPRQEGRSTAVRTPRALHRGVV